MSNFASARLVSIAAAVCLALPALAEETAPDGMPNAGPPPNLECAAEPVTGSGPGFLSNREDSEEAAKANWLEKAKAVYAEAAWETAMDAGISCAVQGLYSKCFAQAIPCKPKGGGDAAAAKSE